MKRRTGLLRRRKNWRRKWRRTAKKLHSNPKQIRMMIDLEILTHLSSLSVWCHSIRRENSVKAQGATSISEIFGPSLMGNVCGSFLSARWEIPQIPEAREVRRSRRFGHFWTDRVTRRSEVRDPRESPRLFTCAHVACSCTNEGNTEVLLQELFAASNNAIMLHFSALFNDQNSFNCFGDDQLVVFDKNWRALYF